MGHKPEIFTLRQRLNDALAELERARQNRLRPEAIERLRLMAQAAECKLVRALERGK